MGDASESRAAVEGPLAARVDELQTELDQLAYVISHDLSAPLRALKGYSALLVDDCGAELSGDGKEFVERIQNAAAQLDSMIEDLLRYSRVATRGRPLERLVATTILEPILAEAKLDLGDDFERITVAEIPDLHGDPMQIEYVFRELLGNALKFRRDTPTVAITAEKRDGYCHISVSDRGIGFDPRFADRIFGLFQRLHTQAEYPGNGAGLAICRKIVRRHGGDLTATGVPDKGATFTFTVPLAGGAEEAQLDA